jgi:hypothetical protein
VPGNFSTHFAEQEKPPQGVTMLSSALVTIESVAARLWAVAIDQNSLWILALIGLITLVAVFCVVLLAALWWPTLRSLFQKPDQIKPSSTSKQAATASFSPAPAKAATAAPGLANQQPAAAASAAAVDRARMMRPGDHTPDWPEQPEEVVEITQTHKPLPAVRRQGQGPPVAMRYTPQFGGSAPAGPPAACLLHLLDGQPFWQVPIHRDGFSIGRGDGNDLQLLDLTVSRQHVTFRYGQGAWFMQDRGSKTSTFVNGRPALAARLNYGDRINIGTCEFMFYTY